MGERLLSMWRTQCFLAGASNQSGQGKCSQYAIDRTVAGVAIAMASTQHCLLCWESPFVQVADCPSLDSVVIDAWCSFEPLPPAKTALGLCKLVKFVVRTIWCASIIDCRTYQWWVVDQDSIHEHLHQSSSDGSFLFVWWCDMWRYVCLEYLLSTVDYQQG